jgi:hypothetical protein
VDHPRPVSQLPNWAIEDESFSVLHTSRKKEKVIAKHQNHGIFKVSIREVEVEIIVVH